MKNAAVLASLAVCIFGIIGCKKDSSDESNYAQLAIGKWVNTRVNNEPVLTDAAFVMELRADKVELYANGFRTDANNASWMETDNYSYSITNETIILNGTDVYKKTYHAEFKILTLDDATMAFNILEVASDGTVHPGSTTYTLSRVAADYSESFKGVWYGKCTSAGSADTEYHYWEYLADGSYIYYYLDANKFWTKKSDNRGRYFLYGNLLASNYANDLISGGSGQAFECWNFSIAGNTMRWTGLRENNKTVTYEMQKVASAPATR